MGLYIVSVIRLGEAFRVSSGFCAEVKAERLERVCLHGGGSEAPAEPERDVVVIRSVECRRELRLDEQGREYGRNK